MIVGSGGEIGKINKREAGLTYVQEGRCDGFFFRLQRHGQILSRGGTR